MKTEGPGHKAEAADRLRNCDGVSDGMDEGRTNQKWFGKKLPEQPAPTSTWPRPRRARGNGRAESKSGNWQRRIEAH